jgi:hypothetical protein
MIAPAIANCTRHKLTAKELLYTYIYTYDCVRVSFKWAMANRVPRHYNNFTPPRFDESFLGFLENSEEAVRSRLRTPSLRVVFARKLLGQKKGIPDSLTEVLVTLV